MPACLLTAGYRDEGDRWRAVYEMENFEEELERMWQQVKPLYQNLHAYVRRRLAEKYAGHSFPSSGHIPAHIMGSWFISYFLLVFIFGYLIYLKIGQRYTQLWDEDDSHFNNIRVTSEQERNQPCIARTSVVVGNMWAQGWGSIFNVVAPYKGKENLDVTDAMMRQVRISFLSYVFNQFVK